MIPYVMIIMIWFYYLAESLLTRQSWLKTWLTQTAANLLLRNMNGHDALVQPLDYRAFWAMLKDIYSQLEEHLRADGSWHRV